MKLTFLFSELGLNLGRPDCKSNSGNLFLSDHIGMFLQLGFAEQTAIYFVQKTEITRKLHSHKT